MTDNLVYLLSDEVEIAAASRNLHDPNGHIDGDFAPFAEDLAADLAIRVQTRMALRNQQVLHHGVYV